MHTIAYVFTVCICSAVVNIVSAAEPQPQPQVDRGGYQHPEPGDFLISCCLYVLCYHFEFLPQFLLLYDIVQSIFAHSASAVTLSENI